MQRRECGLLETASRVVVMQAVAEHTDAILKEKTCLTSSYCVSSQFSDYTKYETGSVLHDSTHF